MCCFLLRSPVALPPGLSEGLIVHSIISLSFEANTGTKRALDRTSGWGPVWDLVPQQLRGSKHLAGVQIVVSQNPLRLGRKGLLGVQMVVSSNPGKDVSVSKEK